MLDLNPEIVDQDKIRKQKRKLYFKIAIIPLVLIVFSSLFFLRVAVFNIFYSISDENQNYNTSAGLAEFQMIGNLIEPFLAHYDHGVSNLRKSNYSEAEEDFRESLKNNPPATELCKVYTNLSLSIEMQADEHARKKNFQDALKLYNKAEAVLYENNCASKNEETPGADTKAEQGKERISDKRSRAVYEMNNADSGNEGGDDNGTPGIPEDVIKEITEAIDNSDIIDRINQNLNKGGSGYGASGSGSGSGILW